MTLATATITNQAPRTPKPARTARTSRTSAAEPDLRPSIEASARAEFVWSSPESVLNSIIAGLAVDGDYGSEKAAAMRRLVSSVPSFYRGVAQRVIAAHEHADRAAAAEAAKTLLRLSGIDDPEDTVFFFRAAGWPSTRSPGRSG